MATVAPAPPPQRAMVANSALQIDALRQTLSADQGQLALTISSDNVRREAIQRFRKEARMRCAAHSKAVRARDEVNEKRSRNKMKKICRDAAHDKRQLRQRKQETDIKRDQARLLSEATRTRDLRKVDARLSMLKAYGYLEDSELAPLVAIARGAIGKVVAGGMAAVEACLDRKAYGEADEAFRKHAGAAGTRWLAEGSEGAAAVERATARLQGCRAERAGAFRAELDEAVRAKDGGGILAAVERARAAGLQGEPGLREAIEAASVREGNVPKG
jgi:hypothetical protein